MLVRPPQREYRTWSLDSRRWANYVARADDIVIATAPKCGTTWTQQIVGSLIFQDAQPRPIPTVSPWIDARFRGFSEQVFANLEAQTHRRFIKTHLPFDGLPLHDEVRYIHVARDGRDALMSMHNHFTGYSQEQYDNFDSIGLEDPVVGRPYPRFPADPAEFFRLWISTPAVPGHTEGTPSPSFFELEARYWAERGRANVLLVHYNDLKADLDGEMRRIAAFLDIAIDEAVWPSLVAAASFASMRAAGEELMPQTKTMFPEGSHRFFNKGVNGRWREALTEDDLALYDAKVRQKLSPALAAWLEGGRLVAGDPRTTSASA
ncbi:MAG TPA: sulfotransferase domain-containing protein [Phenylobacterium sp.]|jgi:aryl sulfotransferase